MRTRAHNLPSPAEREGNSRSFSRISSSDILVFLRVLSAARGRVAEGVGLLLSAGGEMGEVAASLVGGGAGRGSITERVYICEEWGQKTV